MIINKTKKTLLLSHMILGYLLIVGCSSSNVKTLPDVASDTNSFFYIQENTDKNENSGAYQHNNWSITTKIAEKKEKPKTHFYDFTLHSRTEKFTISDINYKYGSYGKWRIIEKKKYLNNSPDSKQSVTIKKFPITIKKTEIPHNQLLKLTLKMDNNQYKYVNLIFGIQKCISKSEKEFICY